MFRKKSKIKVIGLVNIQTPCCTFPTGDGRKEHYVVLRKEKNHLRTRRHPMPISIIYLDEDVVTFYELFAA
jgi:hypothetical protein